MAEDWSFSRSSTHWLTGKRCLVALALMMARTSGFDLSAFSNAVLNCWMKCLLVVDSIVNHQPGIFPSPPTLAPTRGLESALFPLILAVELEIAQVEGYVKQPMHCKIVRSSSSGMHAPTHRTPLRPNSTATSPNGSSLLGIKAKSAPLNTYGGSAMNSGDEKTLPG